ncbi:MAG: nucleoside triphosphate pyrophosphohydrolase [Flavobacteriaceae bacterium]|nr:nucleoside triphosphate pyrophosphohydrolase [Flavobacteriaceae bacterium]
MKNIHKDISSFNRLLEIMNRLRNECPWDKEQTMESLRHLTIEETYELSEAILSNEINEIKNELGDLLLHIVFYSKIASEKKHFDINDVINGICDKLIHRHPHIYSDVKLDNIEEVKKNWEIIKKNEHNRGALSGVPKSLPSLIKAMRIQEKASGMGFKWDNKIDVLDKVIEEIREFKLELSKSNLDLMEDEFGDILFSLVNYATYNKINPVKALEKTNIKFINRFNYLEKIAEKSNKSISKMTSTELKKHWDDAKIF